MKYDISRTLVKQRQIRNTGRQESVDGQRFGRVVVPPRHIEFQIINILEIVERIEGIYRGDNPSVGYKNVGIIVSRLGVLLDDIGIL